jgi:NTE family protein
MPNAELSVVLSGGVALGAYQAGVYEALHRSMQPVRWIAGSSVGAVNGALIVGLPADKREEMLRHYWLKGSPWQADPWARTGSLRHAFNWLSAAQARVLGSPRHLRIGGTYSLYDLQPTVDFLRKTVDFGRLNGGEVRFTVAAVDIETGDPVFFDTGKSQRIGIDHILASCGFLPEFAPVELDDRLLGDGGLAVNAPIEPVLDEQRAGTTIVVDLFARDGARPRGIEAALQRKNGLLFGNQTYGRLDIYRKHWEQGGRPAPSVLYLSYRPTEDEAGPEAAFDFSRLSAEDRWREGRLDALAGLERLGGSLQPGRIAAIRRTSSPV